MALVPWGLGVLCKFSEAGTGAWAWRPGGGGKGWGARGVGQVWARGGLGARSGPGVVASQPPRVCFAIHVCEISVGRKNDVCFFCVFMFSEFWGCVFFVFFSVFFLLFLCFPGCFLSFFVFLLMFVLRLTCNTT